MRSLSVAFMSTMVLAIGTAQAPQSLKDFLAARSIADTPAALRKALSNSDPVVRGVAAAELATLNSANAASDIQAALNHEDAPNAILSMARSLQALGSDGGRTKLESLCSDGKAADGLRVEAAGELTPNVSPTCVFALASIVRSSTFSGITCAALAVLSEEAQSEAIQLGQKDQITVAFSAALQDDHADVREEVAKCILIYRASALLPELRSALGRETNANTRATMMRTLHELS